MRHTADDDHDSDDNVHNDGDADDDDVYRNEEDSHNRFKLSNFETLKASHCSKV